MYQMTTIILVLLYISSTSGEENNHEKSEEKWTGKWFPMNPEEISQNKVNESLSLKKEEKWEGKWFPNDPNSSISNNDNKNDNYETYENDRIMGIPNSQCDDGETNLHIDFDPKDITIFTCQGEFLKSSDNKIDAIQMIYDVPKFYLPMHKCMNETIQYKEKLPTLGYHRPLWPVYGEYEYLPPQRWLHSLEHGAIVFLYNPCADKSNVEKLKNLVKKCLFRHIISPYKDLSAERPLALLAWATSLEMASFDKEMSLNFIKNYAKMGPEKTSKQGQYSKMIKEKSTVISDVNDSQVCPNVAEM